jgi:hypothetical protein
MGETRSYSRNWTRTSADEREYYRPRSSAFVRVLYTPLYSADYLPVFYGLCRSEAGHVYRLGYLLGERAPPGD